MGQYDLWITLGVMFVIFVIILAIKCIPKDKLPYCLGGSRETFVCPARYKKWCAKYGMTPLSNDSAAIAKMDLDEALRKTCELNGKDQSLTKTF